MIPLRLVVVGTVASMPYAGMAWMHMQIVVGLRRLGHDVFYFETTSTWPYDPVRAAMVPDADYALPYLAGLAESFGQRRSYGDCAWFGLEARVAEELLASADTVVNVAGATRLAEDGLQAGRLVYCDLGGRRHHAPLPGPLGGDRVRRGPAPGAGERERAPALIGVAHPRFLDELARGAPS